MLKKLSALLLFSSFVFSQNGDSLLIQNNQSKFDTTFVETTDTLIISDSTKTEQTTVKADSLIPIQGQPLTDVSAIISRNTFLFENYRYTGDLLRSFNLNFIKDLGFIGYPNESFIYGIGNGAVSYMLDGVLWNNRYTNSLDLNLVQSEDIDSIEIVPSPRGFLYGSYNNPVTVNFITRDFITQAPYARIKYYQGPNAEAMIDGRFSALLAKRWNLSFEVTNRSIDSTYINTAFSFWQVNAKLKYFLSNSVNITGWYYFVSNKQGLNGGVNIDSLANIPSSFNIDMYSPEAPVVYPSQKLDVLQNNFGLRTLVKTDDYSKLDLSLYYRYNQDELKNVIDSININNKSENEIYGGVLNYSYTYDFIVFQLLGDYEKLKNKYTGNYSKSTVDDERYGIGGLVAYHSLDNMIKISLFYKAGYWELINKNYEGIGGDIKYYFNQTFSIYAGYSVRDDIWKDEQVPSFETGIQFKKSGITLDLRYVSNEYFNYWNWLGGPEYLRFQPTEKLKSIGLKFNYKAGLFLLETNTSYYFEIENQSSKEIDNGSNQPHNLPDWQFIGGLYVNGLFFSDNLDLKAGFKFYYTGEINSSRRYGWSSTIVEPTNKLDFTLAGEIKKVAIVYFIWENLFGNEYYITPYYPMPERNIRFGIAWELFN